MMRVILLIMIMCIGISGYGQYKPYYKFALGLRAGETSGGTVKWFLAENVALEGIVGYWNKHWAGTILVEKYFKAFNKKELNWYVGGGLHVAGATGYNRWYHFHQEGYEYRDGGVGYGIDAIGGIEFKFPVIPVAVSIDIKPFIEVSSHGGVWVALDPGVGIKLAL